MTTMRVALLSLEPWDQVWRRNQHLASQLVRQNLVHSLLFVEPPRFGHAHAPREPERGIQVINPVLRTPKRAGGYRVLGRALRHRLREFDVLWINDAPLGVHCVSPDQPALYDVTDDWRCALPSGRLRRRQIRAEDKLARVAATVVCSGVLSGRWQERYGISPDVVRNGVDTTAMSAAVPATLVGSEPHIGYIGTLHRDRLDIDLVLALAAAIPHATIHLVGPDSLDHRSRYALTGHTNIRLCPPVPATQVPALMKAMDVLICPHRVSQFTLSLDAIKAYEYRAARKPIVATPTSGFQEMRTTRCMAVTAMTDEFVAAVRGALSEPGTCPHPRDIAWESRAREFARALVRTAAGSAK